MNEDDAEAVVALLDPLLRALEMLAFISRHLHPPDFEGLMASVGTPDEELRSALARQSEWPERCPASGAALDAACDAARGHLRPCARSCSKAAMLRDVYRALRIVPKGLEALYPLAGVLPPVNRFFLDPSLRSDAAVQARFFGASAPATPGSCNSARGSEVGSGSTFRRTMCRPRLAACHGAAWRQRNWAPVSLELAARCTQPRRHSGGADVGWQHLGLDGPRCGHAQPHRASSNSSGRGGTWMRSRCSSPE